LHHVEVAASDILFHVAGGDPEMPVYIFIEHFALKTPIEQDILDTPGTSFLTAFGGLLQISGMGPFFAKPTHIVKKIHLLDNII
jgi:hypothetical protein